MRLQLVVLGAVRPSGRSECRAGMRRKLADQPVIEGHDRRLAAIGAQQRARPSRPGRRRRPGMPFSSITSGTRPSTRSSSLLQRRDMVGRAADAQRPHFRGGALPDIAFRAASAASDRRRGRRPARRPPTGARRIRWRSPARRRGEGRQRVLPDRLVQVVIAAMRDRPRRQPGKVGHGTATFRRFRRWLRSRPAALSGSEPCRRPSAHACPRRPARRRGSPMRRWRPGAVR